MKKIIAFLLAATMMFAMGTTALAAPASSNANYGPGSSQIERAEVTVRIGGNGNSARLIAYVDGVQAYVSANRPANNTTNTLRFDGFVVDVFVRGNSIMSVDVIERPAPCPIDAIANYVIFVDVFNFKEVARFEITPDLARKPLHYFTAVEGGNLLARNNWHLGQGFRAQLDIPAASPATNFPWAGDWYVNFTWAVVDTRFLTFDEDGLVSGLNTQEFFYYDDYGTRNLRSITGDAFGELFTSRIRNSSQWASGGEQTGVNSGVVITRVARPYANQVNALPPHQ